MTKPCPICGEQHDADRTLSYDGKGINSCGQYRERLATFTTPKAAADLGPVFAVAPELLAALEAIVARVDGVYDHPGVKALGPLMAPSTDVHAIATKAIRKAEGRD